MLSTQSGTTQSSALVMNGTGFKTTDTPANFLSYGNNLSIVRAVGTTAKNATGGTTVLIKNDLFGDRSQCKHEESQK
jgi:hypothetical protein